MKITSLVFSLLLASVALLSCSGGGSQPDDSISDTPSTSPAVTQLPVDVSESVGAQSQPSPATVQTSQSDREYLITLYNAAGGPSWINSANWLSNTPISEWHGVTSDREGNVIIMDLHDNQLIGQLPSELGNLANLVSLDLSENNLAGEIPRELGNLSKLEFLKLYENSFTGEVPRELARLTKLKRLELGDNQLVGEIPRELGSLPELEVLGIEKNNLSGAMPRELGNLTSLEILDLEKNQLVGTIPRELGNLFELEWIFSSR